jgi:hypothetical protein
VCNIPGTVLRVHPVRGVGIYVAATTSLVRIIASILQGRPPFAVVLKVIHPGRGLIGPGIYDGRSSMKISRIDTHYLCVGLVGPSTFSWLRWWRDGSERAPDCSARPVIRHRSSPGATPPRPHSHPWCWRFSLAVEMPLW